MHFLRYTLLILALPKLSAANDEKPPFLEQIKSCFSLPKTLRNYIEYVIMFP